jgi:hypothetical protein
MKTIEQDKQGIILQSYSKHKNGNIVLSNGYSHLPKEILEQAIKQLETAKQYAR